MDKKIIWLASYPKCGNTYLRAFLSHYIYDHSSHFSFENLKKINRFESKETFAIANKFISNENNYIIYSLEVQKDPSLPINGDVFDPNVILTVGSSTFMGDSASGEEESAIVSPICTFLSPVRATISPAEASETFFLPIPSNKNTDSRM